MKWSHRLRWLGCLAVLILTAPVVAADKDELCFRDGDRVAWTGSSSSAIGVWPKAMEFLLRTRHPELKLTFRNYGASGGTYGSALQNLDGWCTQFKPTLVTFSFGGVDARSGKAGLDTFTDP